MKHSSQKFFSNIISETKKQNLYKEERVITSSQSSSIQVNNEIVINLCANNYLGLSSHPEIINAAKATLDTHGFGMSSVRFICGTQDIHKKLEEHGINPIYCRFRHRNFWDAGLHCLTVDTLREGNMQSYFK